MSETRTIEVELPAELVRLVDEAVARGTYVDAADYLREVLRRDQRAVYPYDDAIAEALASGPPVPFDRDAYMAELGAKHGVDEAA